MSHSSECVYVTESRKEGKEHHGLLKAEEGERVRARQGGKCVCVCVFHSLGLSVCVSMCLRVCVCVCEIGICYTIAKIREPW